MGIGLGLLRAAGRGCRVGRVPEERGSPRSTVREVCLIGLDRRSDAGDWPAGREVNWLGRTYHVLAAVGEGEATPPDPGAAVSGPIDPARRCYVHLSFRGAD